MKEKNQASAIRRLLIEHGGNAGLLFALTIPIIGGFAAIGLDVVRAVNADSFLERSAKIACDQIRANSGLTAGQRLDLVRRGFAVRLGEYGLDPAQTTISVVPAGGGDMITAATTIENFFGAFVGRERQEVAASLPCTSGVTFPPIAACTVQTLADSFENPAITDPLGYQMFGNLPGWTTTGPNPVELQNAASGGSASLGSQFLELDSTGNSSMMRTVTLTPGKYKLAFDYRSEIWQAPNPASHGLTVCLERSNSSTCINTFSATVASADWRAEEINFVVVDPGNYRFTLKAEGISDGHGGHVDNLRIVECP